MMGKQLMDRKCWGKYNLSPIAGKIRLNSSFALALLAGALCLLESPVQAAPEVIKDSFQLAQVGIKSQTDAPIPLNIRPRTHIPLPADSGSSDDDYHSGYDDGYEQGYDDGYNDSVDYGYRRDRDRQEKNTVIIINPARSTFESYDNSDRDNHQRRRYIRIIRNEVSY
jgi:hypothetical protein